VAGGHGLDDLDDLDSETHKREEVEKARWEQFTVWWANHQILFGFLIGIAFAAFFFVFVVVYIVRQQTEIGNRIGALEEGISKRIEDTRDELKDEIGEVRRRLGEMDQRIGGMDGQLGVMQGQLGGVEANVSLLTEDSRRNEGRFAFGVAEGARVYIKIWQDDNSSKSACGVYIRLHGEYFVATTADVAREAFQSGTLELVLSNEKRLRQRSDFFFYGVGPNVALIPVDRYRGIDEALIQPVEAMDHQADLGTQLYAMSSALGERTAVHCAAVAAFDNNSVTANCRGTSPHEGTGYLDRNGILAFLHSRDAETIAPGYKDLWVYIQEVCQPGWDPATAGLVSQSPAMRACAMHRECFEAMMNASTTSVNNPSMLIVSAHYLHRLLSDYKASGKQNMTLT
jgi:hypothetical protein